MSDRISSFARIVDKPARDYDLALVNHKQCFEKLHWVLPTIFTSHSAQQGHEDIPNGLINTVVAVSEEVANYRNIPYVIRNPIDCVRFRPRQPVKSTLQRVLYLSHPHYAAGHELVMDACRGLNLQLITKETFRTELLIQNADLVIGFGRGLMEAMACGRNVISADFRPKYMNHFAGAGMITPDNFDLHKRDNFTGRLSSQKPFTADSLRVEMEQYNPTNGERLREKMLQEFNVESIVDQYLGL